MQQFDQQFMRGGCQIDEFGATVGYHVREAHQGDGTTPPKA
jgi:capsid protein